jgi:hypothetical protein
MFYGSIPGSLVTPDKIKKFYGIPNLSDDLEILSELTITRQKQHIMIYVAMSGFSCR